MAPPSAQDQIEPVAKEASLPKTLSAEQHVAASDRSAEDRELDASRKPAALLNFFEIAPGQRVAELGAGRGYTTELLARSVGPDGEVFAQNSAFILQRFAEVPWSERLKKPVMKRVRRLDREFDAPFTNDIHDLDAVLNVLFYHDTVWMKVDRDAMNRAVHAALKPGGLYGIVDHSAQDAAGLDVTQSLHRISQKALIAEVTAAGFTLESEGYFLRNPDDTRDWNAAPRAAGEKRGHSDRFVLKFRK